MLFGYTPVMKQPVGIFVCVPKSTKAYSTKVYRERQGTGRITLKANSALEQCEKGLPSSLLDHGFLIKTLLA